MSMVPFVPMGESCRASILSGSKVPACAPLCYHCGSSIAMPSPPAAQARTFQPRFAACSILPLFTAEGERAWSAGWEPRILSGTGERGFPRSSREVTTMSCPWIVTQYRPSEGRASYARLVRIEFWPGRGELSSQPGVARMSKLRYHVAGVSRRPDLGGGKFLADGLRTNYRRMARGNQQRYESRSSIKQVRSTLQWIVVIQIYDRHMSQHRGRTPDRTGEQSRPAGVSALRRAGSKWWAVPEVAMGGHHAGERQCVVKYHVLGKNNPHAVGTSPESSSRR